MEATAKFSKTMIECTLLDKDLGKPGVSVTLTGLKTAPRSIVSSAEGNFRFLNLSVANDYQVVFELTGFQVVTRLGIGVSYGRDVELNIEMPQAALEEEVPVIGLTRRILNPRVFRAGVRAGF